MRFSAPIIAVAAAACLTFSAASADSNPPATRGSKPTTSGKPTTTSTHGNSKSTRTPSTSSTSTSTSTSDSATTSSGSGSTSTSTNSGSTTTVNPIAAKIMSKPALNQKISAMLPTVKGKTMSLNDASMGFKNQGQFIAALHVSQNLGISFMDLKNAMMTKSGTGANAQLTQTGSLGQAIQKVKKSADAGSEVEKAETQANNDLTSTSTTTSSTPTSPKNKKKTTQTGGQQ